MLLYTIPWAEKCWGFWTVVAIFEEYHVTLLPDDGDQGDQIGRNFAPFGRCLFWAVF
jgi:hypothetical protein